MEDIIYKIVTTVNSYLSDYVLIILLVLCGLYFTFKTGFVQLRGFKAAFKKSFGSFSLNGEKRKGKYKRNI